MIIKGTEIGEYRPTPLGSLQVADKHVCVYSSGNIFIQYLYANLLLALVKHMRKNVERDFDNVVVIDGPEGVGKSSITYWIAKLFQPTFDFERQLTYGNDQLAAKLRNGDDKHSIFWLDEAYDIMGKRDWQSQEHKTFVRNLVKMRSRNWTLLMDIPRMEDSDIYVRDWRARYWITVEYGMEFDQSGRHERGIWQLRVRSQKTGKWVHVGYGVFPDMPKDVKEVYKKYKEKSQNDDLQGTDEDEAPGQKYKAKYEKGRKDLAKAIRMLRNMGVPVSEILKQFNISRAQYNHLLELERWEGNSEEEA